MKLPKGTLNECWSTHVQRGTKIKGGKVVPNCVPKSSVAEEKKKKIKIEPDPKKKIGYEVRSVGPGGKTTVTKRRDMPGLPDVGEGTVEPMIGSKISKGREEYLKSKEGKESLRKRKEQDAKTTGAKEEPIDELKMPRGGLDSGTFKNPTLMFKLLTTGGKGKRPRKPQKPQSKEEK